MHQHQKKKKKKKDTAVQLITFCSRLELISCVFVPVSVIAKMAVPNFGVKYKNHYS